MFFSATALMVAVNFVILSFTFIVLIILALKGIQALNIYIKKNS